MLTTATTSCRAMMKPNRATTGHDRRGAPGRFAMSSEEGKVLSIAKPPFYRTPRRFDCLAGCARGYLGEAGNNLQAGHRRATPPRDIEPRRRTTETLHEAHAFPA